MRRNVLFPVGALVLVLLISGCGSTTEDRAMSGAGIGAAGGAVLGAVTGLSIVEGVVIGAAAGGLTGALTDESQIDLGKPFWRKDEGGSASAGAGASTTVRDIQSGLASLGYDPGPVDGKMGPKTSEAIRSYQRDNGLAEDGAASSQLAAHIRQRLG